MTFKKGNSGGPGRPLGSRTAANRILDQLAGAGAEAVLKKQIELAQAGDGRAAELVLKRAWAQPRGRPVELDLPAIVEATDVVAALDRVTSAVASGALTPEEGAAVGDLLDKQRHAIELSSLEDRIRRLEAELRRRPVL